MKKILLTVLSISFALSIFGQEQFNIEELNYHDKYGEKVKSKFLITEIPEFHVDTTLANTIYLENGLRQHDFKNINAWFDAKNNIDTIKEINIVFSKYPVRDGVYTMLIPLLFNRLKELFELDPELNDPSIKWKITLQTNCPSDAEVAKLFHGIVIKYITYNEEKQEEEENKDEIKTKKTSDINKKKLKRTSDAYMKEFYNLPEDLQSKLDTSKSLLQKEELLITYLENKLDKNKIDSSFSYNSKDSLQRLIKTIKHYEDFHTYGHRDSTIFNVFERNKQWKNALVVCDWTGSMYPYGGQLLLWHIANRESSGLKYLTLFNDGDDKRQSQKKIGNTGGIYHSYINNIEMVFDLYNLVMFKGYGGDGPENDIEAIIAATKKFKAEKFSEIILIADNSCVRDIDLLNEVNLPVHVILCGYSPRKEVNFQYFDIAMKTKGSLHTIEFDLSANYYNSLPPNKAVKFLKDSLRIKTYDYCNGSMPSYRATYKFKNTIDTTSYKNVDQALEDKSSNKMLDLSGTNLEKFNRKTFKISSLMALDASNNNISKIPSNINDANRLTIVNLQGNAIEKIPDQFCLLRNIKVLNLSFNSLETLPETFSYLRLLENLDLSNNNISELPRRFYFSKMKVLSLSNNQIATLPYFGGMKNLKILDLSNNKLTELPNSISRLKNLEILDLSNNKLKELPKYIYRLTKLEKIILINNPIADEELKRIENLFPSLQIEI